MINGWVGMNKIIILIFFLLSLNVSSQIVNIESYRLKKDTTNFNGNIDVSFSANKNQKSILQLGINSNLEYRKGKHTIMLISIYNWVKTSQNDVKSDFINDGFQHIRYNYLLLPKLKLESFFQYQYNKIMNLQERDLLGIGLRYKLASNDVLITYIGTSIMGERDVVTGSLVEVNYLKSSNYISCSYGLNKYLKLSNTSYFQFNFDNKYRVYSVFESSINIYKKIYYKISFVIQYDNDKIYNSPILIYSTNNRISIEF